jgi:hypothetical protein
MLDHYIQKNIVYTLALATSLRFGELKPDGIENKLFDYHLKKVIALGYVEKTDGGTYALTPLGRRVGKDALKKDNQLIDRAYSVLFLAIRRAEDGAWLMCRRKTHPLLNRVGFANAQPELHRHSTVTAHLAALQKTGLDCEFEVRGSGYLRMYQEGSLESFTHFTLLAGTVEQDELQQLDELAEYYWDANPDFSAPDMLPTILSFVKNLANEGLFYLEEDYRD